MPRQVAKKQMMVLMQEGYSRPRSRQSCRQPHQSIQRLPLVPTVPHDIREAALHDGRHGHIAKMHQPIREWLEARCREAAKLAKLLSSERAEYPLRGAG